MTMPHLYVMLLTYAPTLKSERAKYAEQALRSALDNIEYSGQVSVHIADDGSAASHRSKMVSIAGGYEHVKGVSQSNSEQRGYGANFNLATQIVHQNCQVVLPLEDDWVLEDKLNLDPFVLALADLEAGLQSIRLGYIGFTQELCGQFVNVAGATYIRMDARSPEPHVNAGHPRVETVYYQQMIGPWAEGLNPGATEFDWCTRDAARHGVAWPLESPRFHHIGTVQAREDQKSA